MPRFVRRICRALLALALGASLARAANTTLTFAPVADSYTNPARATRNYGERTYLTLDATNAGAIQETAFLRFDVPALSGPVVSATLRVRSLANLGTITAWSLSDPDWEELAITWNNQPSRLAALATTSAPRNTTVSLNLSSALSNFTGGACSFALTTNSATAGDLASREYLTAAYRPVLEIVVSDSNRAPSAAPDDYDVAYGSPRVFAAPGLLENDSDPDGDPLAAILVSGPAHGTLALGADGSFTYTPAAGYTGDDSFTYKVRDTHAPAGGGAISQLESAPVTVTLHVLVSGDIFPADELAQIQVDLGVALSPAQQLDLYNLVHPAVAENWRVAAEARIAQLRKAPLTINVVNASGQPLPGATVRFVQKTKPFKFGGVLDLKILNNLANQSGGIQPLMSVADYRARAVKLFDAFGLNNGLKPKQMGSASDPNSNQNLLPDFFSWAASVNRPVRGHLLIWPGLDHMSAAVEAKVIEAEAIVDLRDAATAGSQARADYNAQLQTKQTELRALVDAEITGWVSRWDVYQWDVLNEAITNVRVQNILDDAETAPGNVEMLRWFQLAAQHRVRPGAGLFINEYQIISGNTESRIAPYKTLINALVSGGAPVTGIGFQSRFKFRREHPDTLWSRLQQFAGYGLDLYGTEFEVRPDFGPTEKVRAQITEEVMTLYFSHPNVKGLFAWSYCTPALPAETLLDTHGAPKLNGLVWYYLNRIRYSTRATLTADSQGRVEVDAYKGDYDLVVTSAFGSVTAPYNLDAGGEITVNAATGALSTGAPVPAVTDTTYAVVADAYVRSGLYSSTNYGSAQSLQLRLSTSAVADVSRVACLRFVLPALSGPVVNAVLRLRVPPAGGTGAFSNGETSPIKVYAASSAWTETGAGGVTWNTRPAFGQLLAARAGLADSWLEIALPPSAIPPTGGSVSFALDEQGDNYGQLSSREFADALNGVAAGDYAARLRIVTDTAGGAPVIDTDADGLSDAWELQHGLDANVADPTNLDADGDGRSLLLECLLGRDPLVAEPLSLDYGFTPAPTVGRLNLFFRTTAAGPFAQFSTDLVNWTPLSSAADLNSAGILVSSQAAEPDGTGVTRHTLEINPPSRLFLRLIR